jgi:signal transduction histidine kinase
VLNSKKVTDYELIAQARDGRKTVVSYNATTFYDRDRKLQGVFAAARDMTARKQAEAALLKAGALQKAIFDSANFSSIATDAHGVIQIFNVGAERMLGYAAADVMNKVTPADLSDQQELIARAHALSEEIGTPILPGFEALVFKASRGIEDIYELTYIRRDGSRFPAVVSVTALRDAQNAIIGYLLIGTDNSARKLVEEARERMIQIEKLSSLGTMVGGVAHEINNPLMGVMNYVEYARDKAADAKSVEVLNNALHEIDRIRLIVQHMLVFVRADSDHQAICNVHDSVKRTASLLEGEFRKNAIQLQLDLPPDLPQIKCSASSLQQVLVNLLLNARDAIAGQAVQRITITGQYQEGEVTLTVCDNGPGVNEEIRNKLFDPFFTTKPIGKGTGLGLAVSRQLLEEVGGRLSYNENPAPGACFQLLFKVA